MLPRPIVGLSDFLASFDPSADRMSETSGAEPSTADLFSIILAQLPLPAAQQGPGRKGDPSREAVRRQLFRWGYNTNPGAVEDPDVFRNAPGPGGAVIHPIPESGRPPAGAFQRDPADMAAELDWMLKERRRRIMQRMLNAPDPLYIPPGVIPKGFQMHGADERGTP